MHVRAIINGFELTPINVGSGKQSFKWLASVLQARAIADQTSRTRHEQESFMITGIRNKHGDLFDPNEFLHDHVNENSGILEVIAEVQSSFDSDQWGNPVIGDWFYAAYVKSNEGVKWSSEIEVWRKRLAEGDGSDSVPTIDSNLIQIGDIFSEAEIESVFELDWYQMKWNWLNFTMSEQNLTALRKTLQKNYLTLCNLFAHYCGYGQVGKRYGLTSLEYAHLLHAAKIFDINSENGMELVDKTFNLPISNLKSSSGNRDVLTPLMSRVHLSQSIIAIVILQDEQGSLAHNVDSIIQNNLSSFWKNIHLNYLVYSAADPNLKLRVREYFQIVKLVFNAACSNQGPGLRYEDFCALLISSTLISAEQESLCASAFSAAQLNPTRSEELSELIYTEFLEAVGIVAIQALKSSELSSSQKIRAALHLLSEMKYSYQRRK